MASLPLSTAVTHWFRKMGNIRAKISAYVKEILHEINLTLCLANIWLQLFTCALIIFITFVNAVYDGGKIWQSRDVEAPPATAELSYTKPPASFHSSTQETREMAWFAIRILGVPVFSCLLLFTKFLYAIIEILCSVGSGWLCRERILVYFLLFCISMSKKCKLNPFSCFCRYLVASTASVVKLIA